MRLSLPLAVVAVSLSACSWSPPPPLFGAAQTQPAPVARPQSQAIAAPADRTGADTTQPASPAPIDSGTRGALSVSMVVGVMDWQGNVAMAAVGILNVTSAPISSFDLTCDFVALNRVLGTGRQRVPALRPGEQVNVTVTADVGGQLIDTVRCSDG